MTRLSMWRGRDEIAESRVSRAQLVLIAIIAVTSLAPLLFVRPDDAATHINVFKYLAKTGAFVGSLLLIWQFLLGFRGVVSAVLPDPSWVIDLHKKLGQFGVPIILLHPVFIGLYYAQERGINIYDLDLTTSFSQLVLLGIVMIALIAFIIISSVWARERMGFRRWFATHLASYVILPAMFVHSFLLGPTIQGTGLRAYWWVLCVLVAALLVHRLAHKLGAASARYHVVSARTVADETTEIVLQADDRPLLAAPGQFVYVRHSTSENAHPYSVSAYDEQANLLGVTVADAGPQSGRLQDAAEGDSLLIDGPYGIFTRPARATDLPIAMIAGGIGITPFRRLWQQLEADATREAALFYGNEKYTNIAYRDELDALTHVKVIHVLNDEPDHDGETGFVNLDVLKRHLSGDVTDHVYLLCGPPPMVYALEDELTEAGVPAEQIRHEVFAS